MNDTNVENGIPIGVYGIEIGSFGHQHPETFHLGETGSEGKWVLSPVEMSGSAVSVRSVFVSLFPCLSISVPVAFTHPG